MENDWYLFQEEIKEYFQELGCEAETNVTVKGARTNHDIDILVKSKYLGHNITWIIEAKKWKSKVSKLHVLALRQIVDDLGFDKGFIISENGFQSGAFESANNSNIKLLTFQELKTSSKTLFQADVLKQYYNRINLNFLRYYSHDKDIRIKYKLREETWGGGNFSVYVLLFAVVNAIYFGLKNKYPIELNVYQDEKFGDNTAENFTQLINWLNLNLTIIEERILKAEIEMQKNREFRPCLYYFNANENIHLQSLLHFEKGMHKKNNS